MNSGTASRLLSVEAVMEVIMCHSADYWTFWSRRSREKVRDTASQRAPVRETADVAPTKPKAEPAKEPVRAHELEPTS